MGLFNRNKSSKTKINIGKLKIKDIEEAIELEDMLLDDEINMKINKDTYEETNDNNLLKQYRNEKYYEEVLKNNRIIEDEVDIYKQYIIDRGIDTNPYDDIEDLHNKLETDYRINDRTDYYL